MHIMNIWLIANFELTPLDAAKSARYQTIAEMARLRNHRVTFFSSTFNHITKSVRYQDTTTVNYEPDYDIVFVKSPEYYDNLSLTRLKAHYIFSKAMIVELDKREKPDAIMMTMPPVSLAYEVTKWGKKHGVPVIIDIIDPWPDILRKGMKSFPGLVQDAILMPMTKRINLAFNRAAAITGISNAYINWAKKYNPGIKELHCFYPARKLKEIQALMDEFAQSIPKNPEKVRVIYAGSFASSYDIPTMVKAAEILDKKYGDKIEIAIAGAGPQTDLVKEYEAKCSNLTYLGRLPKDELMKEYYKADVGMTQHIKGATQSVTYKLFDLLVCGLPIMNSLESEMKDIILDNEVGMFNSPHDPEQLAANIEKLYLDRALLNRMKKNAIDLTARSGDALVVYNKAVDLIEKVAREAKVTA
jgi:glycosyltransferase involved in cell wall biosynthesis